MKKRRARKSRRSIKPILITALLIVCLYTALEYIRLPDGSELKRSQPHYSLLMKKRIKDASLRGKPLKIQHKWVELDDISVNLVRAVVASEDIGFFWHNGIEYVELRSAIIEAIAKFKRPRGASTITQQLAKNLYLSPSWSIIRKIKEILIAWRLEKNLSKQRILELYLNYIEWGEGIFGAEAASQFYLNKSAKELEVQEAAFLAAIIPGPLHRFNPSKNLERVQERASRIVQKIPAVIIVR